MKERLPLLVYGQGPVLSEKPGEIVRMTDSLSFPSRTKQPQTDSSPFDGRMNRWGTEVIKAGRELYRKGTTDRFVIMGGRTDKDKAMAAESELIGRGIAEPFMGEDTVPVIETEKDSSNTFENLVNICNQVLDQPDGPDRVDIMGATFHLTRMKILTKLFDIQYRNVIGASDVMLYSAQTAEAMDHETINEVNFRHDGNVIYHDTGLKRAVSDFKDEKSSAQKRAEEDLWTRVLLTVPEYSMPYFARIENDDRLVRILQNFDTHFFPETEEEPSALQKHGINLAEDTPQQMREKLASIKRDLPDETTRDEWIAEQKQGIGWPEEVEMKFQQVLYPQAA